MKKKMPLLAILPLSACLNPVAFGTETKATFCDRASEIHLDASRSDTEPTKEKIADMGDLIDAYC